MLPNKSKYCKRGLALRCAYSQGASDRGTTGLNTPRNIKQEQNGGFKGTMAIDYYPSRKDVWLI